MGSGISPRAGPTEARRSPSPLLAEVRRGVNLDPWLPVSRGGIHSLIDDGRHYIRNGDGREELYDIDRDPDELYNLAYTEGRALLTKFRAALEAAGLPAPGPVGGR